MNVDPVMKLNVDPVMNVTHRLRAISQRLSRFILAALWLQLFSRTEEKKDIKK